MMPVRTSLLAAGSVASVLAALSAPAEAVLVTFSESAARLNLVGSNIAAGDTITQTQSALVLETLISQFLFSKAADTASSSPPPAAGAAK